MSAAMLQTDAPAMAPPAAGTLLGPGGEHLDTSCNTLRTHHQSQHIDTQAPCSTNDPALSITQSANTGAHQATVRHLDLRLAQFQEDGVCINTATTTPSAIVMQKNNSARTGTIVVSPIRGPPQYCEPIRYRYVSTPRKGAPAATSVSGHGDGASIAAGQTVPMRNNHKDNMVVAPVHRRGTGRVLATVQEAGVLTQTSVGTSSACGQSKGMWCAMNGTE